jgi:hypothetical protein
VVLPPIFFFFFGGGGGGWAALPTRLYYFKGTLSGNLDKALTSMDMYTLGIG